MMKSINAVQLGSASHRQPALVEGLQWSALHPLERKRHENVYTKKKKRGQVNGSRSSPWTRMNGSIPDWFLLAKGTRDCILCRRIWFPISLRVWRGPATCCRLFSRRSLQACTGQHRNAISISSLHHLPGSVESEDQSTSHWRERPMRCKEEERKKNIIISQTMEKRSILNKQHCNSILRPNELIRKQPKLIELFFFFLFGLVVYLCR